MGNSPMHKFDVQGIMIHLVKSVGNITAAYPLLVMCLTVLRNVKMASRHPYLS